MNREELLFWKGKHREGFLIVHNHDLHAGFGALLLYALNGIRLAEATNRVPVIDFNAQNSPYFFDAAHGNAIWEYYFEQVSPYSHAEITTWLENGILISDEVNYIESTEAARTHQHDPARLATFWAWEEPDDKALWMREKRILGRKYIEQYVKPKAHIDRQVAQFVATKFTADLVLGVHIRGSDFAYAQPTPPDTYFLHIDKLLAARTQGEYQIFVATDQKQFLDTFKGRYGSSVLHLDVTRSENHIAPFRFGQVSGYQKGEEVLLDILLLSKCHYLFKGAAATGELALWFNNSNRFTDFALESEFNEKQYHQLESTFAQLNVDGKGKYDLKIHRIREKTIRNIVTSRLGQILYCRLKVMRKLLKH